MITQVVNKKKRDKLKKQPETNKPGTESYRKTREELTTYACYLVQYFWLEITTRLLNECHPTFPPIKLCTAHLLVVILPLWIFFNVYFRFLNLLYYTWSLYLHSPPPNPFSWPVHSITLGSCGNDNIVFFFLLYSSVNVLSKTLKNHNNKFMKKNLLYYTWSLNLQEPPVTLFSWPFLSIFNRIMWNWQYCFFLLYSSVNVLAKTLLILFTRTLQICDNRSN